MRKYFGTVKNIAEYPVVVNIKSSDLKISNYEFVDSFGNFAFNLPPDFYVFEAFDCGSYNQYEYFNENGIHMNEQLRFGYYNQPLEVGSLGYKRFNN